VCTASPGQECFSNAPAYRRVAIIHTRRIMLAREKLAAEAVKS
jgi:hypothetical protein